MRIALLHYHLRAGGVSRVIDSQKLILKNLGHTVTIPQDLPQLDYLREPQGSVTDLLESLDRQIGEPVDLWIIHNPTLGKNALFPDLIETLARRGDRLLLQCHDFAEDGRPKNYELLRGKENVYPLAEHVHYAFINRRDRNHLIKAGLPKERCHFLFNAVTAPQIVPSSSEALLIFYPVRGIRRKNLGELCLWAKHTPENVNFVIARAPENPAWTKVHDDWQQFAKQQALPIVFDAVKSPSDFARLLGRASHIASTSVAEGFGLTFLEPHLIKKPLIGRDLPEITEDFKREGISLGQTYNSIPLPLHLLDEEVLKKSFLKEIKKTYSSYRQTIDAEREWSDFVQNRTIDFGNLPEDQQRQVIKHHPLPELKNWLTRALHPHSLPPQDLSAWSLPRYQDRLSAIVSKISASTPGRLNFLDKRRVLERFLDPKRFHFLRT